MEEIKIALKILYVGYKYHGFAMQENYQTIELLLENALKKVNLIKDLRNCNFSKCGRTDIGVSSWSQIVAFTILKKKQDLELDKILNRVLPREVRVTGYSIVENDFDARFNCLARKYKYYFPAQGLNLRKMQEGAMQYKGTFNFKNFCKVNPTKETRYLRTVSMAYIQPYGSEDQEPIENNLPEKEKDPRKFYVFVIQGRAFLWHQVRCLVSCLFMVGVGLEEPDSIRALLQEENVLEAKGRPNYDMAPETPLVLVDCVYPAGTFNWKISSPKVNTPENDLINWNFKKNVLLPIYLQWKDYSIKATQMESLLKDLIKTEQERNRSDSQENLDFHEYLSSLLYEF